MAETDEDPPTGGGTVPRCECGYRCRGGTLGERIIDARRHASEVHGIEVSEEQVLASQALWAERGGVS
jgi:hypothetical protein